jgi:hypothetical protein
MKLIKMTKISDKGTSDPIVNRIYFQFRKILDTNTIELKNESLKDFNNLLFNLMKDFLKVEEYIENYLRIENEAVLKIKKGKVKIEGNSIKYDNPTPKLKENFEHFLIRSVMVLRKLIKMANIIFETEFKGGKDLNNYIKKKFGEDDNLVKYVNSNSKWIKELYDDRGKVEHEELDMSDFDIEVCKNGSFNPILPVFISKNIAIHIYLTNKFTLLFNYIETMIAFLLNQKVKFPLRIVSIKKEERKKYNNFKYKLNIDMTKIKE